MRDVRVGWFVYILINPQGLLYTGITTDPKRRLTEHNGSKRGARYTRGKGPWKIAYLESVADQSTAIKRELAIKRLKRTAKLQLINVEV